MGDSGLERVVLGCDRSWGASRLGRGMEEEGFACRFEQTTGERRNSSG